MGLKYRILYNKNPMVLEKEMDVLSNEYVVQGGVSILRQETGHLLFSVLMVRKE